MPLRFVAQLVKKQDSTAKVIWHTGRVAHIANYFNFSFQETFWRIPVTLNPDRLRRAAEDLDENGASENREGTEI